jgi:hypothetical protein
MSVKFVSKVPQFLLENTNAVELALARMATDIERLASMQVPHDTGHLQSSIRPRKVAEGHFVVEVGKYPSFVPYARRWEFETPPGGFKKGRKSRYLRDSAENVVRRAETYFRNALGGIR